MFCTSGTIEDIEDEKKGGDEVVEMELNEKKQGDVTSLIDTFFNANHQNEEWNKSLQEMVAIGYDKVNVQWAARTLALNCEQGSRVADGLLVFGKRMNKALEDSVQELVSMGIPEANVRCAARILYNRETVGMNILANFWNAQVSTGSAWTDDISRKQLLGEVIDHNRDAVELCVNQALDRLKINDTELYNSMTADTQLFENIKHVARLAAAEQFWLSKELADIPTEDHDQVLRKLLPPHRILQIEQALEIKAFKVKIDSIENVYHASFIRDGENFLDTIVLKNQQAVSSASYYQYADLTFEIVILLLSAVGVTAIITSKRFRVIVDKLVTEFKNNRALIKAMNHLRIAWRRAGGSIPKKAKAIFVVGTELHKNGILWKTIKDILKSMSYVDYAKSIAIVSVQLIGAFASGGVLLIAKIAIALGKSYVLFRKFQNLKLLEEIGLNLQAEF